VSLARAEQVFLIGLLILLLLALALLLEPPALPADPSHAQWQQSALPPPLALPQELYPPSGSDRSSAA
jgi:hypothetical protein